MRMPDSIAVYSAGGQDYIITANEGDDKEYGDFEEKQKFKDVITSCSSTPDFKSDFDEFSFFDAQVGTDACTSFDGTKMRITIGSSAVDYSTPTAPVYKATVGFGGRGLSIWKASDMSLVTAPLKLCPPPPCTHACPPCCHHTALYPSPHVQQTKRLLPVPFRSGTRASFSRLSSAPSTRGRITPWPMRSSPW